MEKVKPSAVNEKEKILRAAGVVFSATLLSRVLGLVRDAVNAAFFGLGPGMDAFLVAFRLPNMLRALLADGTLSVSFIPVFVELGEKEGRGRAEKMGRAALTALLFVLAAVVVAGVFFAPAIVGAVAPGFARSPDKFALTVDLTRVVFPFIGLVAITALLGGILNSRGVFSAPAMAPVALNLCIIGAALLLTPFFDPPITAVAVGVLLGGAAQLVLQLRPAARAGFVFRPDFGWRDPALLKVVKLMGPSVLGVAVYHVNVVVSTFLASWLPDGSVSYLYYAERVFQLPLGVFAVSVGIASLPSLSRLAAREEWTEFNDTLAQSVRMIWFIVTPAAAGIFALADPIVLLLFKRGLFTHQMALETSVALKCYVLALIPVAVARVAAQGFYALKDTSTPVKGALYAMAVNLAASLALMGPFRHAGLAAATALSSLVNAGYLIVRMKGRTGSLPFGYCASDAVKVLLAALSMGALVWWSKTGAGGWADGEAGMAALAGYVAFAVAAGVALYGAFTYFLGINETKSIVGKMTGRSPDSL